MEVVIFEAEDIIVTSGYEKASVGGAMDGGGLIDW